MEGIIMALIPIFVCVVLPVSIVLIIAIAGVRENNNRAKVLIKAIEANNIDADKLAQSLGKPQKSARELLNLRLLRGCIFSFIGLALIIVGLVSLISGTPFADDPVTVPMVFGGISLAVGISYMVVWSVTRKQIDNNDK